MQTLITGATGFVGSHLARLLVERGHTVRVLHRQSSNLKALEGVPFESAIGDVTDFASTRAACEGCDWVFHVAAVADYWRADETRLFDVNVEGTRKVLQAAREAGVKRVIFTSSAAAVGLRDDKPADESEPFNLPKHHFPYGYSKVLAEQVVAEAVAQGQDVVTVNPVIIIGPGDINVISGTFIIQTARLQWLTPWTSGGAAVTDVRDVALWHLAAAEKGRTGERYILSTTNYGYREWFNLIADTIGVPRPVALAYSPNFMLPAAAALVDGLRRIRITLPIDANQVRLGARKVFFDPAKAYRELGTPQYDMPHSIAETYQWYTEHGYIKPDFVSRVVNGLGKILNRRPKS
jgi:dihydroflavonol-4-reductase